MVDAWDRLIWPEKNKKLGVVYISNDHQDLIEVMDIDGNGNLEPREMIETYNSYNTNRNGVLEDGEINVAVVY